MKQCTYFIKTTNSNVYIQDMVSELDAKNIVFTVGDNGIYVQNKDKDVAESIFLDIAHQNQDVEDDYE